MKVAAIIAAMVLVVLALSELGARAVAPYLAEPLLYSDRSAQVKVSQMDRLARREGCVDIAFVGNSMTRDAVDPRAYTAADPQHRRAYNAALDAATPALLQRWTLEEVEPRLHPATVVLGLSSFDLNDNARIASSALESYSTAPLTRDDLFGRLQAPFIEHSALFEYRNELRDPSQLWAGLQDARAGDRQERLSPDGIDGIIGPDGEGLSRRELRYTGAVSIQRLAQTELLNDFHLGGAQLAAAEGLVEELQGRGVEVVLLLLPVTADYIELHPDGGADFQRYLVTARRLAERTGASLVEAQGWAADDEAFADTHHLNGEGALAFSAELPALLADAGATTPACAP